MGHFSWPCAICARDILGAPTPGYSRFTKAIVLWPNGDRISGVYDGYGRLGTTEIDEINSDFDFKMVHEICYKGESYSELGKPRDRTRCCSNSIVPCEMLELEEAQMCTRQKGSPQSNQGSLPGERLAQLWFGEPDMGEIADTQRYVCYVCKHTWVAKWSGGICPFGCEHPDTEPEIVEPFRFDYHCGEMADGLIICKNERSTRRIDQSADKPHGPCYVLDKLTQARVTPPEHWVTAEDGEFKVVCPSCYETNVEIVPTISSPLSMLGAAEDED